MDGGVGVIDRWNWVSIGLKVHFSSPYVAPNEIRILKSSLNIADVPEKHSDSVGVRKRNVSFYLKKLLKTNVPSRNSIRNC